MRDLLPQLGQRRLDWQVGEDERRPALRGTRRHGPIDCAVVDELDRLLDAGQHIPAKELGVDVLHDLGRDWSGQRDRGRMDLSEMPHSLAVPRRHVLEALG